MILCLFLFFFFYAFLCFIRYSFISSMFFIYIRYLKSWELLLRAMEGLKCGMRTCSFVFWNESEILLKKNLRRSRNRSWKHTFRPLTIRLNGNKFLILDVISLVLRLVRIIQLFLFHSVSKQTKSKNSTRKNSFCWSKSSLE